MEHDVKIGSDTMLVAPVRVGARSMTGAGAVVTEDVPPDTLRPGGPGEGTKKIGGGERAAGRGIHGRGGLKGRSPRGARAPCGVLAARRVNETERRASSAFKVIGRAAI